MNELVKRFEEGVIISEAEVTSAGREYRKYLHSREAERCEECRTITMTPVWVNRRYLCREHAKMVNHKEVTK